MHAIQTTHVLTMDFASIPTTVTLVNAKATSLAKTVVIAKTVSCH